MSATNRGYIRHKDDFYRTPKWATHRLLDIMPWVKAYWDPCCGDGRILDAIAEHGRGSMARLSGGDIVNRGSAHVFREESVLHLAPLPPGTAIITNPPYAIAQEVIEHCITVPGVRYAAFLLRLNFLGGKRDSSPAFRVSNMPLLAVLPDRPTFTGYGTDATEYAWFVWGAAPGVRFLDRTPPNVRRKESAELRKLFDRDNGGPPRKKEPKDYGRFNPHAMNY